MLKWMIVDEMMKCYFLSVLCYYTKGWWMCMILYYALWLCNQYKYFLCRRTTKSQRCYWHRKWNGRIICLHVCNFINKYIFRNAEVKWSQLTLYGPSMVPSLMCDGPYELNYNLILNERLISIILLHVKIIMRW